VHLILTIVITILILLLLPGRIVRSNLYPENVGEYGTRLSVSDITTVISAVLTVIRLPITSWSGTVAWRSGLLLMEKGNIDLRQLNWMVSWKMPRPAEFTAPIRRISQMLTKKTSDEKPPQPDGTRMGYYDYSVAIILVLMWPAALGGPLLSGAVDWKPITELALDTSASAISQGSSDPNSALNAWEAYLGSENGFQARGNMVTQAFEYASMIAFANDPLKLSNCRNINKSGNYSAGGQIDGVTYSCIEIGEIKWNIDQQYQEFIRGIMNSSKLTITPSTASALPYGGSQTIGTVQNFNPSRRENLNGPGTWSYTDRITYSPRLYCMYKKYMCSNKMLNGGNLGLSGDLLSNTTQVLNSYPNHSSFLRH
jgi:hypothetical protein